jgi:ubiquinol-cytochrome c reductase cytochrome b subunit
MNSSKLIARQTAAAILLSFSFVAPALASSSAQRARGAADFTSTGCDHCHTIRGMGGHRGPDLSGVGRRRSKTAMRTQILNGSKAMPGFGDVLTPQEVKDLVAYLRACKDKTPARPVPPQAKPPAE